jgi:hypothetical protein
VMAPLLIWAAPCVATLGLLLWLGSPPLVAAAAVGLVAPIPRRHQPVRFSR